MLHCAPTKVYTPLLQLSLPICIGGMHRRIVDLHHMLWTYLETTIYALKWVYSFISDYCGSILKLICIGAAKFGLPELQFTIDQK